MTTPPKRQLDPSTLDPQIVDEAANTIRHGGMILCPTDTCYILVASALDEDAVRAVFEAKRRPPGKPIHVIVSELRMAERYVFVTAEARRLAHLFLPGPLTLILRRRANVPEILAVNHSSLGIRIPDHRLTRELAQVSGLPITATSANASGDPTPQTVEEALQSLATSTAQPDLVLDEGPVLAKGVSTILDLLSSPPTVLREGLIPTDILSKALPELRAYTQ